MIIGQIVLTLLIKPVEKYNMPSFKSYSTFTKIINFYVKKN